MEAGDGRKHAVHDAGPEQTVPHLSRGDYIDIGESCSCDIYRRLPFINESKAQTNDYLHDEAGTVAS